MGLSDYPRVSLNWHPAWRVIPTRFPAIGLFERVAGAEDFDALYALEAMTNDRIRDEVGDISLVPASERLYGEGSTPIMAAFTHLNPQAILERGYSIVTDAQGSIIRDSDALEPNTRIAVCFHHGRAEAIVISTDAAEQ